MHVALQLVSQCLRNRSIMLFTHLNMTLWLLVSLCVSYQWAWVMQLDFGHSNVEEECLTLDLVILTEVHHPCHQD